MPINLSISEQPASTRRWGHETVTLTPPAKCKIQTTGPGASTLLDEGPQAGKKWVVTCSVSIEEQPA